jgi:chromate transporter
MFIDLLMLFWVFFKIGLFTFGGGYAMIPLIQDEVVKRGFLEIDQIIDFIAISESTPGPIAVNMATFVGMSQYGFIGAVFTTLGVVMPSFIIILLIAKFGSKVLESLWFNRAFLGLRPVVIGLICGVAVMLALRSVFPGTEIGNGQFSIGILDIRTLFIIVVIILLSRFYKNFTPVKLIMASALLGLIIFSIF